MRPLTILAAVAATLLAGLVDVGAADVPKDTRRGFTLGKGLTAYCVFNNNGSEGIDAPSIRCDRFRRTTQIDPAITLSGGVVRLDIPTDTVGPFAPVINGSGPYRFGPIECRYQRRSHRLRCTDRDTENGFVLSGSRIQQLRGTAVSKKCDPVTDVDNSSVPVVTTALGCTQARDIAIRFVRDDQLPDGWMATNQSGCDWLLLRKSDWEAVSKKGLIIPRGVPTVQTSRLRGCSD